MPSYSSRDTGDPNQIKKNKQSMADLKLRRLTELNNRLREDLERERIPVSQASKRYTCLFVRMPVMLLNLAQYHLVHEQHKRLHGSFDLGQR